MKKFSLTLVLVILASLCMAPVVCSVEDSGPSIYSSHPGDTYVYDMEPFELYDYGFAYELDSLAYDEIIGWSFSVYEDSQIIINLQPKDTTIRPALDLYRVSDVSYPTFVDSAFANGFDSYGTPKYRDALIIGRSDLDAVYDAVVSGYDRYGGNYGIYIASLPYFDTDYFGYSSRTGLISSDGYFTVTLPDQYKTHFYYFSVSDVPGAPVVLYCYSNSFDTSLILRYLDGAELAEGTVPAVSHGNLYEVEIDYSSSLLLPGTYILEVSSDDTFAGQYIVGIDFE